MTTKRIKSLTTDRCVGIIGLCALALTLNACGLFLSEEAQLKRAQEAQKRGDLRTASIDLKSLLEKHPENREARFTLGIVDLDSGDAVAAARELDRARAAGVPADRVTEPLARAYQTQRQFDKALQLVDAEIERTANTNVQAHAQYLRQRGEILFSKREFTEARAAFDAALKESPKDIRALLGLAGTVEALEGASAALVVTDRALAAEPNSANVQAARGALYLQLRQAGDAETAFQKASELATAPTQKGELLIALGGLAQAELIAGKIDAALKTTARMQELAAKSSLTRYMRAYALAQSGALDQAQELLEQNLAQTDDMRSRLLLGMINLTQGRYAQAEMQLSTVVAAAPNNSEARQLLAQARLRQSKPADALDTLLPAIENGANASASMLALAAQASFAAGKPKEGVDLLKRNIEQHPQDVRAQLDLAAGYLAVGQTDQALAMLGAAEKIDKSQSGKETTSQRNPESEIATVRREYLNVLARMQKGDASGAIAHATKVAQDQPQNAALQSLAGSVLMTQRQFDKARPFAEAVVRLRPNDAAGYVNLGRLDLMQGKADAARQNFHNALQRQPGDATAAIALALLEMSSQKNDTALAVLDELRKNNSKSVQPRVLEAQILLSKGKLDEAEKLARETLAIESDNASALAMLGRVLSVRGHHAEGLENFERAVRAQPKNAPVRYQLAVAQRMAGKIDDALQTTHAVLKIDEHYLPALQLDGLLSVAKGDLATASRRADELLKSSPDQAATHELVAGLRNAQNRFADAAAEFQKAGELNPRPQYAISEYEVRSRGKLASPEAPLEKFLSAHPTDAATRIVLAQAQQQRGNRVEAAQSYELVLTNQPKNAIALNNLAWMHFEDRKPDALDLARRAYSAAPNAPEVTDTYAWILVNSSKVPEGLKLFELLFSSQSKGSAATTSSEIRAHYAVALSRAGRQAEAKVIAKELTAKNVQLSPDVHALLADLIKS